VEAVDDVLLRDVGDGGPHIEETAGVGPEEFVTLLLALGEVVPGSCTGYHPLEVVDENLLEALQESMESLGRLSSQVSGAGSKAIGK
jgi:hypothetical protein